MVAPLTHCGSLEVPLSGPSQHPPVRRVPLPSLALRRLQKGKTHLPKNLLPLQKKGFPLLSKLSMEVIQGTWKTSIAAFSVFMLAKSSVTGTAWFFHSWFLEEREVVCACMWFYTLDPLHHWCCVTASFIYRARVHLTGLWNISVCMCVYVRWMKWRFMLAAEWWEPQCDRRARDDLKPNNVPPWNFLLIPGHGNSGPAPLWLQNQQFMSDTSTSQILRRAFTTLLLGLTVPFPLFFYASFCLVLFVQHKDTCWLPYTLFFIVNTLTLKTLLLVLVNRNFGKYTKLLSCWQLGEKIIALTLEVYMKLLQAAD